MIDTIVQAHKFFVEGNPKFEVFEFLLTKILELTNSEYGFIGEIMYKDGLPFLRTNAITNIAWNEEFKKLYNERKEIGIDFMKLDNLFGLVITENRIIISNDPNSDERRGGNSKIPAGHPPLNAFAGIPFYNKQKMIGMVGIANKADGYTMELIKEINPFITTCSTLIANYNSEYMYKSLKDKYDGFISQVSHDMRTPLNGIIGYKQLFELEFQHMIHNNKFSLYLNEIEKCSEKLLELIDNILDITRTHVKKTIIEINLYDIVNKVCQMIHPIAERNNITIENNIPYNIIIKTDVKIIEDIFSNLLSNAIKYNKLNGKIIISTRLLDNDNLALDITDTGVGICESDYENIYIPFFRCKNTQNVHGNGIGLTSVKKYCDLLNFNISLKSILNEGSTFTLIMPYQKSDMIKTIIYVEDDKINQKLIKAILEKEYTLDIVDTIKSAQKKLLENQYKLYILDYNLPDGNSLSLLHYIKNKNKVLVLTADASDKTKQLIAQQNIKYYMTKPFNIQEFKTIVKHIVS